MSQESERRQVILATGYGNEEKFRELFGHSDLNPWIALEAHSFSQVRSVLKHQSCSALVVSDDLLDHEGNQGLAWLAWQRKVPIVLLIGQAPERYVQAYHLGVDLCLPRDMVLGHPPMLAAGLEKGIAIHESSCGYPKVKEQLAQTCRRMDRLVNLLLRKPTQQDRHDWFSQRYVLERLNEELARTERHHLPLTLALGEIHQEETEDHGLPAWASDLIVRSKRRCDVVGQYGNQGFLLLLVHTGKEGALTCCRRLQKVLEQPAHSLQEPHTHLKTFFGVASLTPGKSTPQALLRCAEENLESARINQAERIAVE